MGIIEINGKKFIERVKKEKQITPEIKNILDMYNAFTNELVIPFGLNPLGSYKFIRGASTDTGYSFKDVELILQKKSNLSSSRRKDILDDFNRKYIEFEGEVIQ